MEKDEIRFSEDFDQRMAERERVRQRIRDIIKIGEISLTRQYDIQPESISDDPGF